MKELNTEYSSIKLCFLSHSSGIAGAEKAFPKLLKGLADKGIKILVLLPEHGPVEDILKENNLEYEIVGYSRWINGDSQYIRRIKRTVKNLIMTIPVMLTVKKHKCSLLYSNTSTILTGAIAAYFLRKQHVWHFREFGIEDYGYFYDLGSKISQYLLDKLSTICLVNSFAVAKKYRKFIPAEKIRVLYESYHESEIFESNERSLVLSRELFQCVMIGTLHEAKGHIDAIRAISLLKSSEQRIVLNIIGTGDIGYKKFLLEEIKKNGIEREVQFWGYLNNPSDILRQSDVLLMCSKNEAYGLVTLEAMKLGKPVIGSQSGGTAELIEDGKTGLLYKPGNFEELSQKIHLLNLNKDLGIELGLNAKVRADTMFTPERYIEETISVLQSLTNSNTLTS